MSEKITENYKTLVPAYGRDYRNKKELEADFRAGKDFQLNDPWRQCYCSIADFAPGVVVNVRYKRLMNVAVLTV